MKKWGYTQEAIMTLRLDQGEQTIIYLQTYHISVYSHGYTIAFLHIWTYNLQPIINGTLRYFPTQ